MYSSHLGWWDKSIELSKTDVDKGSPRVAFFTPAVSSLPVPGAFANRLKKGARRRLKIT